MIDLYVDSKKAAGQQSHLSTLRRLSILVEAYILLVLLDIGLHTIGLDRICALTNRKHRISDPGLTQAEVAELASIGLGAYRWYRPQVACLHRALTLYCLMKRRGVPVELCLGVQAHPFAAHSWVEYRENVIGDSEGVKKAYHILKRIA